MTAIDRLRAFVTREREDILVLTNGMPQERRDHYLSEVAKSEGALADLEALYQAAKETAEAYPYEGRMCAEAVRRVEAAQ